VRNEQVRYAHLSKNVTVLRLDRNDSVDTYLRLNWVSPATVDVHGYYVIQVLLSLQYTVAIFKHELVFA
jgi:hypothetical protein